MDPTCHFEHVNKIVLREFQKIEGSNGTYVSKPGKGACMTSNLKALHQTFLLTCYKKNPHYSPARLGTERIFELMNNEES